MRQGISDYCSNQGIQWKLIPEQSPRFGGLWEAAVKSFKLHLKLIVEDIKVSFEEFTMITTQIDACLNSRSLTPLPENTDEIEALEALLYPSSSHRPIPELKCWHLCQMVV